jgi:hypothetical protein
MVKIIIINVYAYLLFPNLLIEFTYFFFLS